MDANAKTSNRFVRTLIVVFCLLLAAMVAFRYVWIEPRGEISAGIITLLFFVLVLVLAESFDNFSFGKLIAISREAKKKEKEVEKLEKQNGQLLSQLISLSNSQSQNQNHTNVYGDYHGTPVVGKASADEVRDKQALEARAHETVARNTPEPLSPRMNWEKAEGLALQKYLQQRGTDPTNVIQDASLSSLVHGIDPIANNKVIFDGFIKDQDTDTFVELRPERFMSVIFRDRLYMMLSKVNHYQNAKRVLARLDLIIMRVPGEPSRPLSRTLEDFSPAIASGLLKVIPVEFTEEEAAACRSTT
jgi:hypothetical protein